MVVWVVLKGYMGWCGVYRVGCIGGSLLDGVMVGSCWVVHIRLGGNLLMVVWVVLEVCMGWGGVYRVG